MQVTAHNLFQLHLRRNLYAEWILQVTKTGHIGCQNYSEV